MSTVLVPADGSYPGTERVMTTTYPTPSNPLHTPVIIDAPTGFDAPILNPTGQLDPNP